MDKLPRLVRRLDIVMPRERTREILVGANRAARAAPSAWLARVLLAADQRFASVRAASSARSRRRSRVCESQSSSSGAALLAKWPGRKSPRYSSTTCSRSPAAWARCSTTASQSISSVRMPIGSSPRPWMCPIPGISAENAAPVATRPERGHRGARARTIQGAYPADNPLHRFQWRAK